jgi:class 3 adenylate cyclase
MLPGEVEASAVDGERKTVTTLFADIKGSMELIEDLDPEEVRDIVNPALKLMIEAVHHYGGYVAQSTSGGIFALFGAPLAHEIIRSVRCTRRSGCRKRCGATRRSCVSRVSWRQPAGQLSSCVSALAAI